MRTSDHRFSTRLGMAAMLLAALWLPVRAAWAAPRPAAPPAASCPTTINFGETLLCSLSTVGEVNSFSFTAAANDRVIVRMGRRTSGLNPQVAIVAPDTTTICDAHSSTAAVDIAACLLPNSGVYTILASNYNSAATGDYALSLQRLNSPANAAALAVGQTQLATLSVAGELQAYTFMGAANDRILARMGSTASALTPHVRIYAPDGASLCETTSSAAAADIPSCLLPSSGQYALIVSDYNGVDTGSYGIALQRLTTPANVTALAFGQTLSALISAPGGIDAFAFSASGGDTVVVRVGSATGAFDPHIRLYGPDGVKLCEVYTYNAAITSYACILPSDGSYSVLVNDYSGADSGSYGISLQRVNNPAQAQPLVFGLRHADELVLPGELDTYTFTASGGDVMLLRMGAANTTIYPQIWLFGPDGALVCNANGNPAAVEIPGCILPSNGRYTILVNTFTNAATGGYGLTFQRVNNPDNAIPLRFGQTKVGTISAPGAFDTYRFTATASSPVRVRMSTSSNGVYPSIRLYGPDGALLCQANDYPGTAEISRCVVPSNAAYTLIATNYNGAGAGSYGLTLLCLAANCGPAAAMINVFVPLVRR